MGVEFEGFQGLSVRGLRVQKDLRISRFTMAWNKENGTLVKKVEDVVICEIGGPQPGHH